jgi:hypothetical protein
MASHESSVQVVTTTPGASESEHPRERSGAATCDASERVRGFGGLVLRVIFDN